MAARRATLHCSVTTCCPVRPGVANLLALLADALAEVVRARAALLLGDGERRCLVGGRLDDEAVAAVRFLVGLAVLVELEARADRVIEDEPARLLQPVADHVV